MQCTSGHSMDEGARRCETCGSPARDDMACVNGHAVAPDTSICPKCGVPVGRSPRARGGATITPAAAEPMRVTAFWSRALPRQVAGALMVLGAALVCVSISQSWATIDEYGIAEKPGILVFIAILGVGIINLVVALRVLVTVGTTALVMAAWSVAVLDLVGFFVVRRSAVNAASGVASVTDTQVGVGWGQILALVGVAVVLVGATLLQLALVRRR